MAQVSQYLPMFADKMPIGPTLQSKTPRTYPDTSASTAAVQLHPAPHGADMREQNHWRGHGTTKLNRIQILKLLPGKRCLWPIEVLVVYRAVWVAQGLLALSLLAPPARSWQVLTRIDIGRAYNAINRICFPASFYIFYYIAEFVFHFAKT